ncbi:MAG: bifunctional 4-hydroxy-2-oxoglutarate aldolase/2-dehydro-3-deoxy-phosphogluconate aldolase [Pseudomonadota bacterium]
MDTKHAILEDILSRAPVVPVLVVDDVDQAVALATALVTGGLPAIEVTLRTQAALDAVRAIGESVEGAIVGAGTVRNAAQLEACERAGARFAVSPGSTPALLDAAGGSAIPLLPGASSASEAMALADRGYALQKFFPAGPAGGAAFLKALESPLPDIRFCPTGGVDADNAGTYLALSNVICVGGSWVAPKSSVASGDWTHVTALARKAAGLGRDGT